ncbi:MAG: phosphatase PAP2 family protein [Peptostreptococcaceae bacterium]|nr:phosphatase PAP2 family protein [Peptostreptococcaceae bacterium]
MPTISKLGDAGIVWIILTITLLISRKYRRAGFALLFALILDVTVCNIILKPLVARVRPCDVNTTVQLLIARPTDYSFPSGHTAASFAAVSSLYLSQQWLWKPALVLAILISFSRLYLYVHYPTDIFAGIMLGIIVGYLGYKLVVFSKSLCNKRKQGDR